MKRRRLELSIISHLISWLTTCEKRKKSDKKEKEILIFNFPHTNSRQNSPALLPQKPDLKLRGFAEDSAIKIPTELSNFLKFFATATPARDGKLIDWIIKLTAVLAS